MAKAKEHSECYWLIYKYMTRNHIETIAELVRITGFDRATFDKYLERPSMFRLNHAIALDDVLHFDDEDWMKLTKCQFKNNRRKK